MAKKCIRCGNTISDNARFCEYCGYMVANQGEQQSNYSASPTNTNVKPARKKKKPFLTVILLVLFVLTVVRIFTPGDSTTETVPVSDDTSASEEAENANDEDVFEVGEDTDEKVGEDEQSDISVPMKSTAVYIGNDLIIHDACKEIKSEVYKNTGLVADTAGEIIYQDGDYYVVAVQYLACAEDTEISGSYGCLVHQYSDTSVFVSYTTNELSADFDFIGHLDEIKALWELD